MSVSMNDWKTDNYKFVGQAFDVSFKNKMNKLKAFMGEVTTDSIDYEIEALGGYGEMPDYNGTDLNMGNMARGFKTIIVPQEKALTIDMGYKKAKVDKLGECKKVGTRLGYSAAMTAYLGGLRVIGGAFTGETGGDGKTWAAADHPVASKSSQGRSYIADPDAGTYSNLMTDALSVAAVTKAQALANRFVTPDGFPFVSEMNLLLVSPELEETAKKICGEGSGLFASDLSDVNPVEGSMKYVVVGGGNFGFGKKQWAVCDPVLMKEAFKVVYITKPRVLHNETDNPLIDRYTGYADFAYGWGDARMIIFSNPA